MNLSSATLPVIGKKRNETEKKRHRWRKSFYGNLGAPFRNAPVQIVEIK